MINYYVHKSTSWQDKIYKQINHLTNSEVKRPFQKRLRVQVPIQLFQISKILHFFSNNFFELRNAYLQGNIYLVRTHFITCFSKVFPLVRYTYGFRVPPPLCVRKLQQLNTPVPHPHLVVLTLLVCHCSLILLYLRTS